MKEIEATRLKLAAMELVDMEPQEVEWFDCIRHKGSKLPFMLAATSYEIDELELALGIIEGKPVWEDSQLFAMSIPVRVKQVLGEDFILIDGTRIDRGMLSWLPPKPKTAMVELLVDDIEMYVRWLTTDKTCWPEAKPSALRIAEACRKTLRELK